MQSDKIFQNLYSQRYNIIGSIKFSRVISNIALSTDSLPSTIGSTGKDAVAA